MRIINPIVKLLVAALFMFGQSSAHMKSAGPSRPALSPLARNALRVQLPISRNASDNLCAAFGWRGYVDTDLDFSEFFSRNHTVAARFMIQYTRSYQAPILSVKGSGSYLVAVAGYGEGRVKAERLLVMTGGKTHYYTVKDRLAPEKWHWLAVVRDASRLRLYLDGALVNPDDADDAIASSADMPEGTLRLGRKASGDAQFYGFIDDVAVFNSALSTKTLKSYYQERSRLRGDEEGLVAAYLFDQATDAQTGAHALRRRVSFSAPAVPVKVSAARDGRQDANVLPLPANKTRVLLPFAPGTAWRVIQGYGQALSHNGGGCFSWDFARLDGASMEQPVYACAAGRVVAVSDNNDPEPADNVSKDNFNYLQMEMAPGEVVTYLHMKNGSLIEALRSFAPPSFPRILVPFPVAAGAEVGKVGNTWLKEQPDNWHLHFAGVPYVNSPVSIPLAFSDYEVYDPQSKTWRRVERGVPQQNQVVRRAP
jgi:murein DD-endopeptidase MepM/ murein hydrolase activator NlpD